MKFVGILILKKYEHIIFIEHNSLSNAQKHNRQNLSIIGWGL